MRNSDGGWLPGHFACGCGCRRGRSGSCGAAAAASARAWCAWQRVIGCCTVMRACAAGHRSRASGRVISIPGSRRSSSPDSGIERVQRSGPRRAPRGPAADSGKAGGHTRGPRPAPIQSMITGAGRRAGRRPAVSGRRGSAPRAGRCRRRRRPGCRRARRRKDRSGRRGEAPRRFRAPPASWASKSRPERLEQRLFRSSLRFLSAPMAVDSRIGSKRAQTRVSCLAEGWEEADHRLGARKVDLDILGRRLSRLGCDLGGRPR